VSKTSGNEKRPVTVYHNVGSTCLTIKSPDNIRTASVVNMQGSAMATQKYAGSATEETMSIAHLSAGIYIVSVETSSGVYATKFFKE
jgi:hypothetical protein